MTRRLRLCEPGGNSLAILRTVSIDTPAGAVISPLNIGITTRPSFVSRTCVVVVIVFSRLEVLVTFGRRGPIACIVAE